MEPRSIASRVLASVSVGLVCAGLVAACSGSNAGGSAFDTGGPATGGPGSDASLGSNSDGGNGQFGDGSGGNNLGDAACAAAKTVGQQLPLDMYIMLDQSGSMSDPVSGGGTKWSAVTGALNAFVTQPNVTGIAVGLQFFGVPPSGGTTCPPTCNTNADCGSFGPCLANMCLGCFGGIAGDSCLAADYAKPAVEIAPLPGVGAAISSSIAQHGPSTSTPTSAALQGAVDHATAWAKTHAGDATIVVLATDGDPTECDTNLAHIDAIAAGGANGTPKILTFVIGVGASLSNLNGIAAAGGTTKAFFVDTTQNVNQQFLDALNKIRGTVLGCTYKIPVPTNGTTDFTKVNVQYVPGGGGSPQVIPQVADQAHCPTTGEAWYYDNASAPTNIILCAATCTTLSADAKGEVDVLTGCKTVVR